VRPPLTQALPASYTPRIVRRVAALALALDVAATLAIGVAMAFYPGGTGANPQREGHAFWQNVLCDLAQPLAFNGMPNDRARPFAQFGTVALFVSGALLCWLAPVLVDDPGTAKKARRTGIAGGLLAAFLPVFPSERYPLMHSLVVLLAGPFGLATSMHWLRGLTRGRSLGRGARRLTLALACAVATSLAAWSGWFSRMLFERGPDSDTAFPAMLVPPAQRVALLLFIAWIAVLASLVLRGRGHAWPSRRK
jgi:hypothetical protein